MSIAKRQEEILERLKALDMKESLSDLVKKYQNPETRKEMTKKIDEVDAAVDPYYDMRTVNLRAIDPTFNFAEK
jgi:hypothetical protein